MQARQAFQPSTCCQYNRAGAHLVVYSAAGLSGAPHSLNHNGTARL